MKTHPNGDVELWKQLYELYDSNVPGHYCEQHVLVVLIYTLTLTRREYLIYENRKKYSISLIRITLR